MNIGNCTKYMENMNMINKNMRVLVPDFKSGDIDSRRTKKMKKGQ